jgi:hypothetical protein
MKLSVIKIENRGTEDSPFGYVYFNDDTRLGWAPGLEEIANTEGLFPGNRGGNTVRHFSLALRAIKARTKGVTNEAEEDSGSPRITD